MSIIRFGGLYMCVVIISWADLDSPTGHSGKKHVLVSFLLKRTDMY